MESKNIEVTVAPGVSELIIREGDAPKPIDLVKAIIVGDITAVASFLSKRESTLDKNKAIILFDEQTRIICLKENPHNPIAIEVIGKLEVFPELKQFGINEERYFGLRELEKFVRMNRIWFSDKEQHMKLCLDLRNFQAKVESMLKDDADQRGNKNKSFSKTVISDLAADFILSIPLFKGESARVFRVDICYDVTDSQARFWLESVEMEELKKGLLQEKFSEQKSLFSEMGFVVISQ